MAKLTLRMTHHLQACIMSLGRLTRAPFTSLMTITVLAIALALPTGLFVMLHTFKTISQGWSKGTQISIYLKKMTSEPQVNTLMAQLRAQPNIKNIRYISPETGLESFKKNHAFDGVLSVLNDNPLPAVIVIYPTETAQTPPALHQLLVFAQQQPNVDSAKLDLAWVQRLQGFIELGKRIVSALSLLLGAGVLFIVGNTIHLAMQSYRKEIEVYKLIGATNAFVRRPFLYCGIWYGLLASGLAWGLITLIITFLQPSVQRLTQLYHSEWQLHYLSAHATLLLLSMGTLLGYVGAMITAHRDIKRY